MASYAERLDAVYNGADRAAAYDPVRVTDIISNVKTALGALERDRHALKRTRVNNKIAIDFFSKRLSKADEREALEQLRGASFGFKNATLTTDDTAFGVTVTVVFEC